MKNYAGRKIEYNGKVFQEFKEHGLTTFLEIKDNRYVIPTPEDLKYLQERYTTLYYDPRKKHDVKENIETNVIKEKPVPKKKRKVKGCISAFFNPLTASLLGAVIAIGSVNAITNYFSKNYGIFRTHAEVKYANDFNDYKFKDDIVDVDSTALADSFSKSLEQNENLDDKEKEYIADFMRLKARRYGQYLDDEAINKALIKLDIRYRNELSEDYLEATRDIANCNMRRINVLEYENIDELIEEYEVFDHELEHFSSLCHESLGNCLEEGITSELTDGNSYTFSSIICGMISELVGHETILKQHYSTNTYDVIKALKEIKGSSLDGVHLITLTDYLHDIHLKILYGIDDSKNNINSKYSRNIDKNKEIQERLINQFVKEYTKYYKAKYKDDIYNNTYLCACIDYLTRSNHLGLPIYDPDNIEMISVKKDYLNQEKYLFDDMIYIKQIYNYEEDNKSGTIYSTIYSDDQVFLRPVSLYIEDKFDINYNKPFTLQKQK